MIPGAIICAAICLESPGGPIYSQKRICRTHRDGRIHEFTMYKFRSMYKDADERLKELQGCNEVGGAMFKMKDDPRVTRVGRFLRKHSIDEFPQFINVFLGQMTVVGPRPPLPYEVAEYDAWAMQRLAVSSDSRLLAGGRAIRPGLRRHGRARPEVHPRAQPPGEFQDHPADYQESGLTGEGAYERGAGLSSSAAGCRLVRPCSAAGRRSFEFRGPLLQIGRGLLADIKASAGGDGRGVLSNETREVKPSRGGAEEAFGRWLSSVPDAERTEILGMDRAEREDAFYRELAFGTGGLRGRLGPGPIA